MRREIQIKMGPEPWSWSSAAYDPRLPDAAFRVLAKLMAAAAESTGGDDPDPVVRALRSLHARGYLDSAALTLEGLAHGLGQSAHGCAIERLDRHLRKLEESGYLAVFRRG